MQDVTDGAVRLSLPTRFMRDWSRPIMSIACAAC
ncbi:hypothetical protein [Elstera litoralis]